MGARADHVACRPPGGRAVSLPVPSRRPKVVHRPWPSLRGWALGPDLWPLRLQAPWVHQALSPWKPQEPLCHLQPLHTLPLGLGAQPGDRHLLEARPRHSGVGDSPAQLRGHQGPGGGSRERRPAGRTAVALTHRHPLLHSPCPEHREPRLMWGGGAEQVTVGGVGWGAGLGPTPPSVLGLVP